MSEVRQLPKAIIELREYLEEQKKKKREQLAHDVSFILASINKPINVNSKETD